MHLLVTGSFDWTEEELNTLRALGHDVAFMQWENAPLPCEPAWVEGIIGNGIFLTYPIEQFSSLRYIQLTSAGLDRVPLDYVRAHGIELHDARGAYSVPMAEFALCGVLQLYKQSGYFRDNQKAHRWEKHRGLRELGGKTVCIVGCGSVGNACAERFRGFGCHVIGVTTSPYRNAAYEEMLPSDGLEAALGRADVAVLTLPLKNETRHLINAERLSAMKRDAVLVNIARGAIVDTDALTVALTGDTLGGAVLDVFEEEPLPLESALWELENVIVTPHNSFVGDGDHARVWDLIRGNLERITQ